MAAGRHEEYFADWLAAQAKTHVTALTLLDVTSILQSSSTLDLEDDSTRGLNHVKAPNLFSLHSATMTNHKPLQIMRHHQTTRQEDHLSRWPKKLA